jgi:uncharacterized repeat protein (TIGR04138 family)
MHEITFEEIVDQIRAKDPRYPRDAYLFLREALDFTQKSMAKTSKEGRASRANREEPKTDEPIRHVTGQELLNGIRNYALQQFGPMVPTVFEEWGIRGCEDFGEIVFNMVETGLLAKTDKDSRADFKPGYDFAEAFRNPFLPAGKKPAGHVAE